MTDNLTDLYARRDAELDAELAEVLTAISIIAKRLAIKIKEKMTKEAEHEKEGIGSTAR